MKRPRTKFSIFFSVHSSIDVSTLSSILLMSNSASTANFYSIVAGVSACSASIFGKLTFSQENLFSPPSLVHLTLFVISNVFMWRSYSKALSLSSTSIQPTILTKTINFFLSALFGFLVFSESINLIWFIGFLLIIIGVYLISSQDESNRHKVSSHSD